MLSDADRELITAAVDGALDDRREPLFRALVADSAEAAALFHKLQGDARRLREARRVPAPPGLADCVVARVRDLPHTTPSSRRAAAQRPTWLTYAVAASLLLAVAAGSYWYVARSARDPEGRALRHALPTPQDPGGTEYAVVPRDRTPEVVPAPRAMVEPEIVAIAPRQAGREAAPTPRPFGFNDVIGSRPAVDPGTIAAADIRLPLRATVADLDRPEWKAKVAAELARDPAFRLDLFVHDPLRAAEVFQTAAQAAGVDLIVDATAQERIKRKLPTTWAVYTESLTADELAAFLAQLAARTRAADATPVFASAHLFPAQQPEQRELRELLGVDPLARNKPAARKDRTEKPTAILLGYSTGARVPPALSKEVKTYLDRRDERKPAAVPLLIVIRPVS
jgi:hypothetical protein